MWQFPISLLIDSETALGTCRYVHSKMNLMFTCLSVCKNRVALFTIAKTEKNIIPIQIGDSKKGTLLVVLNTMKVIENKERLGNCHRLEETENMKTKYNVHAGLNPRIEK